MNNYVELRVDISPCDEIATDVLAALLCEKGYESFVPDETGLTSYVKEELFDADAVREVIADFPLDVKCVPVWNTVEGRDWNSEWEKNYFKPIVVGDKCVIHSSFHKDVPEARYDIVIDPKMAFGTGHHQTTSLIIEQLVELEIEGKSVMDMGTGTGILAILAAMRGASRVEAVEIDEFAHVNAVENVRLNDHPEINVMLGDAARLKDVEPVDIFIANINRNIITADLPAYVNAMKHGALALFSGFYEDDIPVVLSVAEPLGLVEEGHTVKDRWTCLKLRKK